MIDQSPTIKQAIDSWLYTEGNQPPLILSASKDDTLMTITQNIIQSAVCSSQNTKPCGSCKECVLAKSGTHPDVIKFSPASSTVKVKDIRLILDQLSRTAWSARRVIAIHNSHLMSAASANTLLKSLEEPANTTRWVLTTRWPQRLLPTIRSRSIQLRLTGEKIPATANVVSLPTSSLTWLTTYNSKEPLSSDTLTSIETKLETELRTKGTRKELHRAFLRLRDYYVITGARGNERLARDVLLAALAKLK